METVRLGKEIIQENPARVDGVLNEGMAVGMKSRQRASSRWRPGGDDGDGPRSPSSPKREMWPQRGDRK